MDNKKILIVEDEEEALGLVSNILARADYEVFSTTKGREAVVLAKEKQPHLIILDIILGDTDGGEIASTLSDDPETCGIPIIFLTGVIRKTEEQKDMRSGKHSVLAKPVTKDVLLKAVEQVFV
ncbi:MAG: response regulator [Candidatus Omnitrophica bacterium]|nr:response regulator [Candidatus Omnitrophota bacterium]